MSQQEVNRLELLQQIETKRITQVQASELLSISEWQIEPVNYGPSALHQRGNLTPRSALDLLLPEAKHSHMRGRFQAIQAVLEKMLKTVV